MSQFHNSRDNEAEEKRYIVTFGSGQPHHDRYVEVFAYSEEQVQRIMFNHYGNNWANVYRSEIAAGVSQFGLTRLQTIYHGLPVEGTDEKAQSSREQAQGLARADTPGGSSL